MSGRAKVEACVRGDRRLEQRMATASHAVAVRVHGRHEGRVRRSLEWRLNAVVRYAQEVVVARVVHAWKVREARLIDGHQRAVRKGWVAAGRRRLTGCHPIVEIGGGGGGRGWGGRDSGVAGEGGGGLPPPLVSP